MSTNVTKEIPGVGRTIDKSILSSERATPSIINFSSRVSQLEIDMTSANASIATLSQSVNDLNSDLLKRVPVGSLFMYSANTEPEGFLFCDGRYLDPSIFSDLFAVIGHNYGILHLPSTNINYFRLPDFRGRSPIGVGLGDAGYASNWSLGEKGGAEKHTLTINQMPTHTHSIVEGHLLPTGNGAYTSGDDYTNHIYKYQPTSATGGSRPHSNMHPVLTVNFIIKY